MTANEQTPGDDLEALIARVQVAQQDGESHSSVRMQLVQEGVDPNIADTIVERVYSDAPLSERDQDSSRRAASSATAGGRTDEWGWLLWVGGLIAINGLSYFMDWGFWIW